MTTTMNNKADLALDFVVLYVSDLEASLEYLTTKVGFTRVVAGDGPNFRQLAGAEGSPGLGLLQVNAHTPAAGNVQLYFKTHDLSGLRDTISSRDVKLEPIRQMPFGSIFDVPMTDNLLLTMLS